MYDGFPFEGQPFFLPLEYDTETQVYQFDNVVFCSASCCKGYLQQRIYTHADDLSMLTHYIGVQTLIKSPPDPRFIVDYMIDPTGGMTIEEFRTGSHPVLARSVYVCPDPLAAIADRALRAVHVDTPGVVTPTTSMEQSQDPPSL